ncbi:hypothetical protein BJY01DRAFT_230692 [Aspergillus pseudoustus]|uniref:NAD-dependent epimerase/dehydratase domain-containing protein n=1 Tax=Aspergillus pseudoustus TaxID=1810923 RepID=A0ABR4L1V2_9EURO
MAGSILITGISGYIGGSIPSAILDGQSNEYFQLDISALVRSNSQAAAVDRLAGVHSVTVKAFDELDRLEELGEQFDSTLITYAVIIILIYQRCDSPTNWDSYNSRRCRMAHGLAKAFVNGLSKRRAAGKKGHYNQIFGTSNLSDRPHSANFVEMRTFSEDEDIYSYEKSREAKEHNVLTCIVMAPTIFGLGTGPFNKWSVQLPAIIADALQSQHVKVIGGGQTAWSRVHIEDLTDLFVLLVRRIVNADVRNMSLLEGAGALRDAFRAELSFGANLGWKPSREGEWAGSFAKELKEYAHNKPQPKALPRIMRKK